MYKYIICKFVKSDATEPTIDNSKLYVYDISDCPIWENEDYFKQLSSVNIGDWYFITNENDYSYKGSRVEIEYIIETERPFIFVKKESENQKYKIKKLQYIIKAQSNYSDLLNYFFGFYISRDEDCLIFQERDDILVGRDGKTFSCVKEMADYYNIPFSPEFNYSKENEGFLYFQSSNLSVKPQEYKIIKQKEKNNMNKIFGNVEFGKYRGNEIRISMSGLAYKNNEGRYIAYDSDKGSLTDVTEFIFDSDDLIYLFPVAIKDIEIGDIIKHSSSYMIVTDILDGSLETVDPVSGEIKNIIPTKNIFGFNFYTKVVSLINSNSFGKVNSDNPFGNMLPFFLLKDNSGEGLSIENFMLMNLLNGGQTNIDFQSNPLLMCLFLDNKDKDNLLPLLLMNNFTGKNNS